MLKRFLGHIKLWVLTLFSKLRIQIKPQAVDNPVSSTPNTATDPVPIQKEIPFFTKENSLLDQFDGRETYVHGVGDTIFEGQKMRAIKTDEPQYVDDMPDNSEFLKGLETRRAAWRAKNGIMETVNYEDYARKQQDKQ